VKHPRRGDYGDYGRQTRRNIFLPDTLVDELKSLAADRDMTYSELVRMVLLTYVRKLQPK
jgi:predicted DNA binding CopG/RHH family protein